MPPEPSQTPPNQPPLPDPAPTPAPPPPVPPTQPGVITPTQQPAAVIQSPGPAQPQAIPGGKSKGLPLMIAGGTLVGLAIIVSLFLTVFNKHISAKDVTDAQTATKAMSGDVSSIAGSLTNGSDDINDVADFNAQVKDIQGKLADAEKQYGLLQKSKTLKDAVTDQKFKTLQSKWAAYDTYVNNNIKDGQAIFPPVFQFLGSIDTLSSNPPTTVAQTSTYLASFKSLVDTASSKLGSVNAVLPEDQLGVSGIKAYLNAVSNDIAAAQKDLAAGNLDGVNTDLTNIDSEQATLDDSLNQADTQSNSHEEQLDPTTAITNLQTALSNLQDQVSPSTK